MSKNRATCMDSIYQNAGVDVELVTPENLDEFIVSGFPLHPAYDFLSLTHKADYLRCYFMHHHGGGYTDIKMTEFDWNRYFDSMSSGCWAIGYQEIGSSGVAARHSELYEEMSQNFRLLIGNCAYIFRDGTPLTQEWYDRVHVKLDEKLPALKEHPGRHPRDFNGKLPDDNKVIRKLGVLLPRFLRSEYPLGWSEILGDIFHPLVYKYTDQIIKIMPWINTKNYL